MVSLLHFGLIDADAVHPDDAGLIDFANVQERCTQILSNLECLVIDSDRSELLRIAPDIAQSLVCSVLLI